MKGITPTSSGTYRARKTICGKRVCRHFKAEEQAIKWYKSVADAEAAGKRPRGKGGKSYIPHSSGVYFIQIPIDCRPIKIGYSADILHRFRQIQSHVPWSLKFKGWIPGDRETESLIHEMFAEYHLRGEWFTVCQPMMDFIQMGKERQLDAISEWRKTQVPDTMAQLEES